MKRYYERKLLKMISRTVHTPESLERIFNYVGELITNSHRRGYRLGYAKALKEVKESGIPRCMICKTPMVNAYDHILKQISPYMWKTTCGHNEGLILSVGGREAVK